MVCDEDHHLVRRQQSPAVETPGRDVPGDVGIDAAISVTAAALWSGCSLVSRLYWRTSSNVFGSQAEDPVAVIVPVMVVLVNVADATSPYAGGP